MSGLLIPMPKALVATAIDARRAHEPLLIGRARRHVHAGVIGEDRAVRQVRRQQRRHFIHGLARGAIDDRAARLVPQQREQARHRFSAALAIAGDW